MVLAVLVIGVGIVNGVGALIGLFSPAPEKPAATSTTTATQASDTAQKDSDGPTSTPKSNWKKGTVPELFQTDPAWADDPYAGGTIGENGCGVTCMSMVYIALTGKADMGPVEMAEFSEENDYVEANSTSWRFMTDGGAQLGLTVETLPDVASRISAEVEAGHPVIVNVGPGAFTKVGHYIVLVGVDDDGRIRIHNPNAPEDNETSWDLDTIMHDARNYWAFSA